MKKPNFVNKKKKLEKKKSWRQLQLLRKLDWSKKQLKKRHSDLLMKLK